MRTMTFDFADKDLERLDKLREAGYKFVQVMLMDKRGRDRYVDICVHNPDALCPHGFVLDDNTCGPCSEGRPNRNTDNTGGES
jgi:hypothetical protein